MPGELYRSAQPTASDIQRFSKKYGIKSIINLRGAKPGTAWYDEEVATAKALGIAYTDFPMKAARELTNEEALALIDIMRKAPKPLLIHCRSGSDRTGLAAAMYVAAISKKSEFEAEYQLSLRYGHIPLWFTDAAAMQRTFERMEPLFGYGDT